MSWIDFPLRLTRSALIAICLAASGAVAAAQDSKEVTVTAPEVSRERVGRSNIGAPIDLITVQHAVSYADLDLSKTADAAKLDERIRTAAQHACRELQTIARFESRDPACVRRAIDRAMVQANAAIAAASR
jgi:UrcA family protein